MAVGFVAVAVASGLYLNSRSDGHQTHTAPPVTAASAPSAEGALSGLAIDALRALPIKGRAPKAGYKRAEFGQAWADVDRNGCDTRNDMLRRDLASVAIKAGTNGCVVAAGRLTDPYTGRTIEFTKGDTTSPAVQIDHVVALSDAWQKGAQQWPPGTRLRFANDPLNLLAVDGPTNTQKGDGDAATWLPPNKPFRCRYVARQVSVKLAYGLWVTQAEHDAVARVVGSCPGERLPSAEAFGPPRPLTSSDVSDEVPVSRPASIAWVADPADHEERAVQVGVDRVGKLHG